MRENIVTGKKYRILVDEIANLWDRISFWTKASDVEFDDGSTVEENKVIVNQKIEDLESQIHQDVPPHADPDPGKYGRGSSNLYGHVRVSDDYTTDSDGANSGVAFTRYGAYHLFTWARDFIIQSRDSRAPIPHASADTTYGKGDSTNYGHVKLSANLEEFNTGSNDGTAATPSAVSSVAGQLTTSGLQSSEHFYFGKYSGKYGFYTDSNERARDTGVTFHPFSSGAVAIRTRFYSKVECICAVPKDVNSSISVNAESTFGDWQGVTADGVTVSHMYSSGWSHKVSTTVAGTIYGFNGTHHLNANGSYTYDGEHAGSCYFISDADANA